MKLSLRGLKSGMKSLEYSYFTGEAERVDVFTVFCEYCVPKYNNNIYFETGWYAVKNGDHKICRS